MPRPGLDLSPLHLLHRADQYAADIFKAEISEVTPRQLALLWAVAESEVLNQATLAVAIGADRSTVSDLVKRLCRKGLLQRQRTLVDRRAYAIILTAEGRRLLRSAVPLAQRVDDRLLKHLPADRRAAFMAALASIVAAMTPVASKG